MKTELETYTIENSKLRFTLLNKGSTIIELSIKDKNSLYRNVVLAYDDLEDYKKDAVFLNSVVGLHAGRIKDSKYTMDSKEVQVVPNEGNNQLHGGPEGLHLVYFDIEKNEDSLVARYTDDKNTEYIFTYSLKENDLIINLEISPQAKTLVNTTQHTYFNLNGERNIGNQLLRIDANTIYDLDETGVPHNARKIKDTVFDFRKGALIKDRLVMKDDQFKMTGHIDHPYVVTSWPIQIKDTQFGINLDVFSDADTAVVYFGNTLGEHELPLSNGRIMRNYSGIAIEPQNLPNGVNLSENHNQFYDKERKFNRIIKYTLYTN